MGRRSPWRVLAVLSFVALGACRHASAKGDGPSASLGTAPPQATTTTTSPYAVPPVIDAAYVNRVITGLDQITGDVVRMVVAQKTIPPEAVARLKAIYATDAGVDRELDGYSQDLSNGLAAYRSNPGNKITRVQELITTSNVCIYVRVVRDYSPAGVNGATASTEWIAVRPVVPSRDPLGYNVTGWAYLYEGFTQQRIQPAQNPCTG